MDASKKWGSLAKQPTEKLFNDAIHGEIKFSAAVMAIVDTRQFSRLKKLRQNGNCSHVFMNANHSRFEHSLGTGHLAEVFARNLQLRYPEKICEKDVLCVTIAGVCHDLGHGPDSHLWEEFIKENTPDGSYRHEDMTLKVFDDLLDSNGLRDALKINAGLDEQDITFIKELMTGLPLGLESDDTNVWLYKGRGEEKAFIYEVVANKNTGIDVDKFDYMMRDNSLLNIGQKFRYKRYMDLSRIEAFQGRNRIVVRDTEALDSIKKLIGDRTDLHRNGYQHSVVKIIDRMTLDMWSLSSQYIKMKGENGAELALSETYKDVVAHQKLDESGIATRIADSTQEEMRPARELLDRIWTRDFYPKLITINRGNWADKLSVLADLTAMLEEDVEKDGLKSEDLTVMSTKITTGMTGTKIPVYSKPDEDGIVHVSELDTSDMFGPDPVDTVTILLKRNEVKSEAQDLINKWKVKHNLK